MQFFKNILGFGNDLGQRIDKFKARGALFQVVKDTRNIKFKDCTITFSKGQVEGAHTIDFRGDNQQCCQLPIHLNMNAVTFTINKGGKPRACFEWQLQQETQHVGCNMQVQTRQQFRDILCLILKNMAKDEHIKDYHSFCKQLAGVPVYKTEKQANSNVTSGIASEIKVQLNQILIAEAQKDSNKMVHSCSYYRVELRQRKLVQEHAVFVLRELSNYQFEFHVINATGYVLLRKKVDSGLNYQINVDKGYIRWIDTENDCQLIEINFEGKRDAALSLKYNMLEVMYELREKRKLEQDVSPDQIAFMKKMSGDTVEEKMNSKVVEIYKEKETIQNIGEESFLYEDADRKKGAKYDNICQAHNADFSIVALGSLMETLKISEDNVIKPRDKRRLVDLKGGEVEIGQILLHDSDSKAFIRGQNGKLYYQDLVKGKLVEQFNPSPQKGIINMCPERKINGNFNTFKVISENSIYEIDPRTQQGVGSLKDYSTNPQFVALSSTGDGNFVTGSKKGQIRFYKQIGKNATNKFTSGGDPVIHLDTTKDGKWSLATFRRYLRLIPTETNDDVSLFDKKVSFADRPTPIKLEISLEDLQKYGIKDFCFLPAKFDESNNSLERFIISGFGDCTVIWSLSKAIKGDRSYIISKSEGKVDQADFIFNDPGKLIMATSQGIVIKQNKIRK